MTDTVLLLGCQFSHGQANVWYQEYGVIAETIISPLLGDNLPRAIPFGEKEFTPRFR
jgi:hypothetical protein